MSEKCESCGADILKAARTPAGKGQRPGLASLGYRWATHDQFKRAMKSRIAAYPGLRGLTTRDDDDPSTALLDACAAMLDVLTFYQERIANEGFLRTATERRSIGELAAQIGYELNPGVAASVPLAFTVEDAPGAPGYAVIGCGTKVQSVPGPDEKPQVFETVLNLEAKAQFNRLKPATTEAQRIYLGMCTLFLKGTGLQLKPGDVVLIAGNERLRDKLSENWDVRVLHTVTTDADRNRTVVTWLEPLGSRKPDRIVNPAQDNPKVFAMRQRAALFGHNAPDPLIMNITDTTLVSTEKKWLGFSIDQTGKTVDLDAAYPRITKGGWIVLARPGAVEDIYTEAYHIEKVNLSSRSDFALASEITRIVLDTDNNLDKFGLRETIVYGQSEELEIDETLFTSPETEGSLKVKLGEGILAPVEGARITLDSYVPGLSKGQLLIVSGKAVRLKSLVEGIQGIHEKKSLQAGGIVRVIGRPVLDAGKITFSVKNPAHFTDIIEVGVFSEGMDIPAEPSVEYVPAAQDDEAISEAASIESIGESDGRTVVYLSDSLKNVYDRATVSIYANCVPATHGETVREVLGSGDAAAAFQEFVLKRTPLTYVSAVTPGGSLSTLEIRVNDVLWREVPSLYGQATKAQVYTTRIGDDGKAIVRFGDGVTGSRLPSGVENVTATYRIGTGREGIVKPGQASLLMTRPLGAKAVTNPGPSAGARDPESRDQARQNAPFTVLTFDRVVSMSDYGDFARRFAGIGKAGAAWLWNGRVRLVHVTVAGEGGAGIEEESDLLARLGVSIKTFGLPHQHFLLQPYRPLSFSLKANLLARQGHLADNVIAEVRAALIDHFSFEKRSFGQAVTKSEVIALIQGVDGVEMADLDFLKQGSQSDTILVARKARWEAQTDVVYPAELLTIDPDGIELTLLTE